MVLNNIIFSIFIVFFTFFLSKLLLFKFDKSKIRILSDDQFKKPQAFHENSTYRLGGLIIFIPLIIVYLYMFFFKNIFYLEYILFSSLFFILGFLDDLKLNLRPKLRLFLMIIFLLALVIMNDIYIEKTGIEFLNELLTIDIFSLIFICLCFLFIVNGSNLIDGFNGLLGFHSLIIFFVLAIINFINENNNLTYLLYFLILLNLVFLNFNYPKARLFLGDSGAYLIGILISFSAIKTSIDTPSISPFFFSILLFYLFFEVFFSFIRKLVLGKNPLLPDNQHLHMCLYKNFLKNKNKSTSNYLVTLYINCVYLLSLIPAIIFMNNGLFCKYYFLLLLLSYVYFYRMLYIKIR